MKRKTAMMNFCIAYGVALGYVLGRGLEPGDWLLVIALPAFLIAYGLARR